MSQTVEEAQAYINENREEGVECPCCGHKSKVWEKPLIGTAVADLIRLVRFWEKNGVPAHISEFTTQRSNFYTLSYWGLIMKGEVEVDNKKRSSGYWVPTIKGGDFVEGKITIPSIAATYNNKLVEFRGRQIGVKEALGKKFNYEELMKG